MGLFEFFADLFGVSKKAVQIVVVGLDNSGKSTLINHLKPKKGGQYEIPPTVGFSMEQFSKNNITFTAFDMSGQNRYRALWEKYYSEVQGIIFVVDSTDRIRMCVAKDEVQQMLAHEDLKARGVPILFFANKMDKPTALLPADVMEQLSLSEITDKPWAIKPSNALTGEGVEDGITWLATSITKGMKGGTLAAGAASDHK